ncbi:MAG: hypothetical protein JNM07_09105 [Phycisphaerae bacterium]|nr:hypothetical protein [Phycisphaerae bacterium]
MLSVPIAVAACAALLAAQPETPPASPRPPAPESPTSPTPPPPTPPPSESPPSDVPAVRPAAPAFRSPARRAVQKTGNLLKNPSFEDDAVEWWSFARENPHNQRNTQSWVDFSISGDKVRTGSKAALLALDSRTHEGKTCITGIVQEIKGTHMPEKLSGWYFVEDWERGTPKQYLQAVVILWNDASVRARQKGGVPSIQIAYTLAGVTEQPLNISNRKFVVSGEPEPKKGEWVRFELTPRDDFIRLWNVDPSQFEFVRVLFECRYDGKETDDQVATAKVYYDDVYFGD